MPYRWIVFQIVTVQLENGIQCNLVVLWAGQFVETDGFSVHTVSELATIFLKEAAGSEVRLGNAWSTT